MNRVDLLTIDSLFKILSYVLILYLFAMLKFNVQTCNITCTCIRAKRSVGSYWRYELDTVLNHAGVEYKSSKSPFTRVSTVSTWLAMCQFVSAQYLLLLRCLYRRSDERSDEYIVYLCSDECIIVPVRYKCHRSDENVIVPIKMSSFRWKCYRSDVYSSA